MFQLPLDLIDDQALHLYPSTDQAKVVLETWQNTTVHQDLGTLDELVMEKLSATPSDLLRSSPYLAT